MSYDSNLDIVREFIEKHDLRNRHSQVIFNGRFEVTTEKTGRYADDHEIKIDNNYDSDGEVDVMDIGDIDVHSVPTSFKAKWQEYDMDESGNLLISGRHPNMGEYDAIITPYNRTKD